MGSKTNELISTLEELHTLLKIYHVSHWQKRIAKAKLLLEQSDYRGIETLLGLFGGMGSLNDLIISRFNDDEIDEEDEESINRRLRQLTSQAYSLADDIRREVELDLRKD